MNIATYMLSCEERTGVRRQTLASFRATDWNESPNVDIDSLTCGERVARMVRNYFELVQRGVDSKSELILLLEDDLRFNRHLRYNLERWYPLANAGQAQHFLGSLFNPNIRMLERHDDKSFAIADPKFVFGSQALVVSSSTARHVAERWDKVQGPHDLRVFRLASEVCPLYFHCPSLVQHVGFSSTWGGPFQRANDFQPDWKRS
jgi:hypothetical protein